MPASLLPAKVRRQQPPVQVASLVRIAKRASIKADWIEEVNDFPGAQDQSVEVAALRAKALAATREMCAIVNADTENVWHWSAAQRAAARRGI